MSRGDEELDREIDAALEGVDLQEIGGPSRPSAEKRTSGGDRLYVGVVEGLSGDDVIVELGPRMQGVASLQEFDEPPQVGDRFQFMLRGREDELWILSRRDAVALATWDELEVGSQVKARVSGQNKGGLELKIGGHDAFMPASQAALERVEDLSGMIGQTLVCQVMEIDRQRRRVVLTRRAVLEQERRAALEESVGKLHAGLVLRGKVTRIESFGAFVDMGGGLEGLVHLSNLSRRRVERAGDVVQVGQEVQVQVLEIKEGGKRVGLSMKALEPDPWDDVDLRYAVDSIVQGKVTRLLEFGAFVELEPGLEGLLHVSQMSAARLRRPSEAVKPGEELSVRIQAIDPSARRLSLSRLDARGAVIGSEDAIDEGELSRVLDSSPAAPLGTNLGALFKKALEERQGSGGA